MTVTLDLPEDVHRAAVDRAARRGVPVETFLTGTVTAVMGCVSTDSQDELAYLRGRAARADLTAALAALDAIPDVPPDPWDRLPDDLEGAERRK